MELKAAVGTSTFIMTFTALIASVSHILIHPAILLERWPVLVLCMTVATAASLTSARFANRVGSRTVGLVTSVVLTLLGAALAGHRFGRHHVTLPLADPKKTWEGSAAIAGVSAPVGTASILVMTSMPWPQNLYS